MTITQKFATLTPEQREKFKELKDAAAGVVLDAFLDENNLALTDEEKAQALEYLKSGKLPLADEELENVAGGGCGGVKCNECGGNMNGPGATVTCKSCGNQKRRPGVT
ncbi:MAG: hypothetical protein FWH10_04900 [Oscillospiraceae bacterium]|nr:hypothetical protein [Oscillospiraceae bacterium]